MKKIFATLAIAACLCGSAWAQEPAVQENDSTATEQVATTDSATVVEAAVVDEIVAEEQAGNPALALSIIALALAGVAFITSMFTFVMVKNNKNRIAILHDKVDKATANVSSNNEKIDMLAKSMLEIKAAVRNHE